MTVRLRVKVSPLPAEKETGAEGTAMPRPKGGVSPTEGTAPGLPQRDQMWNSREEFGKPRQENALSEDSLAKMSKGMDRLKDRLSLPS